MATQTWTAHATIGVSVQKDTGSLWIATLLPARAVAVDAVRHLRKQLMQGHQLYRSRFKHDVWANCKGQQTWAATDQMRAFTGTEI